MQKRSFERSGGPSQSKSGGKPQRQKRVRKREVEKCRFCRDKAEEIDYKDLTVLFRMVTNQGKQFSRKRTGNCAKHQRMSCRALKRARFVALMPFTG